MEISPEKRRLSVTAGFVTALYAVTFVHHLYGGVVFDSPERTLMALVFSVAFAATYGLYWLGRTRRWARGVYWAMVYAFWVISIGIYEGGFNHALFAVLRLFGASDAIARIYPAGSDAVISDNVFFQGTGVLTLIVAVGLAIAPLLSRRESARDSAVAAAARS